MQLSTNSLPSELYWSTNPQGSKEWLAEREGLITGTLAASLGPGNHSDEEVRTLLDLNVRKSGFILNKHTTRGTAAEPLIRKRYEELTGNRVIEVGFSKNSRYPTCGASLDGVVAESRTFIEIKCIEKHKPFLDVDDGVQLSHYLQIQFAGLITNMVNCHYIVYCMETKTLYIRNVPIRGERSVYSV